MTQETVESQAPVEPTADGAVAAPAPAPVVEPVNVADLRPRLEAMKASRTLVAAEAGITVAQLYRIEMGGRRTTADEAKNVRSAIERIEQAHKEQAERDTAAAQATAAQQASAAVNGEGTENGTPDPS